MRAVPLNRAKGLVPCALIKDEAVSVLCKGRSCLVYAITANALQNRLVLSSKITCKSRNIHAMLYSNSNWHARTISPVYMLIPSDQARAKRLASLLSTTYQRFSATDEMHSATLRYLSLGTY